MTDARLLAALRTSPVHLLPGDLGAPLAEIETALTRLRAAGFDIESKPGLGCRLLSSPDRLIADDLHARLGDCALAREILVFSETSSTNDVATRLGREGRDGIVVFAERQTAGRGRFGRRWESAEHAGLWFSVLLRPAWLRERWPLLTTWAAVAVSSAVERVLGAPVQIKWPNDVLARGRKLAGILIESSTDTSGAPFAVAGIGLNVNQTDFPPELAATAASLRQLAGRAFDRPALAASLLNELDLRLGADPLELVAEASRRSCLLGNWVQLSAGASFFSGTAESIDSDGHLLLRGTDGILRRMTSGEVTSHAP